MYNGNFTLILIVYNGLECELMLELMNEFAIHVNVTWGREAAIKVHCSTGQVCDGYLDPRSDEPINFNFLPVSGIPYSLSLKRQLFFIDHVIFKHRHSHTLLWECFHILFRSQISYRYC